jgi:hypothetical protein
MNETMTREIGEAILEAKRIAWNACVLAMSREGVIDWDRVQQAMSACPYLPANRWEQS